MIWPQRSLITHRELAGPGALEPGLWAKLQFLSEPLCAKCGMAFEIAVQPGQVCAACVAKPPAYQRARAALVYGDVSRRLVLVLKYQKPAGWAGGFVRLDGQRREGSCWPRPT